MENTEVMNTQETNEQTEERTFTQAELNAIVSKRVSELTAKYENYEELKKKAAKFDEAEEASKSELQKATEKANLLQQELDSIKSAEEARQIREDVAKETGVPAHLLTGSTKEECEAQAKDIMAFAKPGMLPTVPDGGEVRNTGGKKTRDQFADFINQL